MAFHLRTFASPNVDLPLKNKQAIWLLFAANSVSGVAQGITMISVPWYYTNVLDRKSEYGWVYMLITAVSLFWSLYCGTLVDRYNRKHLFMGLSVAGFLIMGALSFTAHQMGETTAIIAALAFAQTVFIYNVHFPSLYAFAQEITEPRHYSKITSYIEVQNQLTMTLAGAVAAILLSGTTNGQLSILGFPVNTGWNIEPWPMHRIFALDTLTYALAFSLVIFIRYKPIYIRNIQQKETLWDRLKGGFNYLSTHPLILRFGFASYFVFVTVLVSGFYLMAVYIDHQLHADAHVYASGEMYFALGSVIAGLSISTIFKKRSAVFGVTVLTGIAALIYFILSANASVWVYYLVFMLLGTCNAGIRILRMTYLFNHVPNDVIGRAGSIFSISGNMVRIVFIGMFSMAFFNTGNHVIYATAIFGLFVSVGLGILLLNYKALVERPKDPELEEQIRI